MSLGHLKLMAFLMHRQIRHYERETNTRIPLPMPVLNSLHVGLEDWDAFWGY